MAERVARVLIDSPLPQLDRLFDYAIPPALAGDAIPGVRVRVPLRSAGRVVDAYLVEVADAADTERPLSELDAVVSTVPVLPTALYELARRVADRAAGSASDILRLVIPKRQVRVEKAWRAATRSPGDAETGASTWAESVLDGHPGLAEAITRGERLAVDAPPRIERVPDGTTVGAWSVLLAAAAVHTLATDRSAILVVPDYRDQDQLVAALRGRAPEGSLVVLDAQQSGPDRYRAFLRMLEPTPCVVVGKRSAVYAPVHGLGLVALWDDGDPLLEEPLAPYVHPRDAALVRQGLDGGALLFAGHTRTTDVERLVGLGWVRAAATARRESPRVVLTPSLRDAPGTRIPSAAFQAAREALESGPVLVQVARPGYAPVLVCAQCRAPARCAACRGPLNAARAGATPTCGWCGQAAVGWVCPACSAQRVRFASSGTERTADELGRAFPRIRVIVADGDHPVTHVDERPALVVATRGAEPIADGGYRAVILLDGERMLLADSLRIGESCLRWWSNAAALAASGAPVHLVGVEGSIARAIAAWTQAAYARAELGARAPLLMPPTVRVASLTGSPRAVQDAIAAVRAEVPALEDASVLGPVPAGDAEGHVRALLRFDYARGARVAESLRAVVVAEALRGRRRPQAGARGQRNTLRVRIDLTDPEL